MSNNKKEKEQATSTVTVNGEQAKQELTAIAQKAENLKWRLKEANEAGDGKAFTRLSKELKATQKEMRQLEKDSFDLKKVLNNLSGSSITDLAKAKKELDKQFNSPTLQRNSKEWNKVRDDLKAVKKEMSDINNETKVGESRISKFSTNFKRFVGIAIVGALFAGIRGWINDILEFSQAVSQLSAITGATGEDLVYLKNKAKELGAEYGKSATEVVEAMKLVGSAKPELLENAVALSDMTESVLVLSKASGMELSKTTSSLATIMNQFGLSATEANATINSLAAGSKYGSVEVDYLADSISKVGAVAKTSGLDLNTTVAVMELFGEKGIKAEIAGTGFKSLLVELQKDTKNYTNGVFDLNKAIDNNQSIAGNNIALTNKFGKEYFNLAQILFQNKERFVELNKQVTGTNTAFEQYAIATDNLTGDIDKLSGSWSAFILALEDGQGPMGTTFRKLIQWAKEAVDSMQLLTKTDSQIYLDAYQKQAESKLNIFKDLYKKELEKGDMSVVTDEITDKKSVVSEMEKKLLEVRENIKKEKAEWGILANSRAVVVSGERMIKDLNHSIKIEKTYINTLGGLRKSMKVDAPIKDDDKNPTPPTGKPKETQEQKDLKALEIWLLKRQQMIKEAKSKNEPQVMIDSNNIAIATEEEYQKAMLKLNIEILNKKLGIYKKGSKEYLDIENQILDIQISENLKANEVQLKVIEQSNKSRETALTVYENAERERLQDLYDDGTYSQQRYNSEIIALELVLSETRLFNAKQYQEQIVNATYNSEEEKKNAIEAANKGVEAANNALLKSQKNVTKDKLQLEKEHQDKVAKLREELGLNKEILSYQQGLDALKEKLKIATKEEKEAADVIAAYKLSKTKEYAEQSVEMANQLGNLVSSINDAQLSNLEATKQKELKAAGTNSEKRELIEKKYAQKELDLKKKQADANMGISIAQSLAQGALGIAEIWAKEGVNPILAGILTALLVGITSANIATAVNQRNAIKSQTLGYYDGGYHDGYTGGTDPNEVRGKFPDGSPYHGMEYIADHRTTQNKAFRKVFDLAEYAKKTNRIASISTGDIANAIGINSGYYGGGYKSTDINTPMNSSNDAPDYTELVNVLHETRAVNAALLSQIRKGIKSTVAVSGKNGIQEATETYTTLINNAKKS